jgi:hypothetical protein
MHYNIVMLHIYNRLVLHLIQQYTWSPQGVNSFQGNSKTNMICKKQLHDTVYKLKYAFTKLIYM